MPRRRIEPIALALLMLGCSATSHPTEPAELGVARSSRELLALIDQPGPLEFESVASADWAVDRAGLINLDHPAAKAAKLVDGDEPIQVYFHVITHPTRGTFIVDTGVDTKLRDAPGDAAVSGMVANFMHLERMKIHAPLGEWLKQHEQKLAGVLLTHTHADHVMGLPDVPNAAPVYVGPGEVSTRSFLNLMVRSLNDRLLAGKGPLRELRFSADAAGRFAGVRDLFGDGSLWALYVPGHTPGSLAFVARTTQGPVLLTGDTCHTAWGWAHDVEPGSFTGDRSSNAKSLAALRRLAREHPQMRVLLGHQPLAGLQGATKP
jgi:glyoxylase-like metal-dependent hydrolase (beta-lactamase superfamily II)